MQRDSKFKSMVFLDDLFMEAAETERKLPPAIKKQKMASWPEYVRSWQSYGWNDAETSLPKATPQQITRFEQAMDLLNDYGVKIEDKRLIWATAHSAAFRDRGPSWAKVGRKLRIDPRTVKKRYFDALIRLYYRL